MKVSTITQPAQQLGAEVSELLSSSESFSKIVFVSAFVALRTVLRLREILLQHAESGTELRITAGIDLGGTSRGVLEELLRWKCETFIFHNPNPRATFHPKTYLFERQSTATLFVGSNNLTDGGFYTNYEAATRYEFDLPADADDYAATLKPLAPFLFPQPGQIVRPLDIGLIQILAARGELPTEAVARGRKRHRANESETTTGAIPVNPFSAVAVPLAPLLPNTLRIADLPTATVATEQPVNVRSIEPEPVHHPPQGTLLWQKVLPRSDALQVNPGTSHVGGVRLTQARFENPLGHRIDQTTYFRELFADYAWERETGRQRETDQEHTFVPIRIVIRGMDYGVHNFEISHKPSGEAGQDNYTTILRWGRVFSPIIQNANVAGTVLSLYEVTESDADFLIDIADNNDGRNTGRPIPIMHVSPL